MLGVVAISQHSFNMHFVGLVGTPALLSVLSKAAGVMASLTPRKFQPWARTGGTVGLEDSAHSGALQHERLLSQT